MPAMSSTTTTIAASIAPAGGSVVRTPLPGDRLARACRRRRPDRERKGHRGAGRVEQDLELASPMRM